MRHKNRDPICLAETPQDLSKMSGGC